MIKFLEHYLQKLQSKNDITVKELSTKLQKVYDPIARREYEDKMFEEWQDAKIMPVRMKHWNLNDIYDYNNQIYFDVAAIYLEDLTQNLSDYLSDPKNILVDSLYVTKMEEEYLLYVAQKHQEKNESNSRKLMERINDVQEILQNDAKADKNLVVKSHPLTVSLLNERRQKEEDAKCGICNSGEYEEHDLIVFCGFCGIAVHQS